MANHQAQPATAKIKSSLGHMFVLLIEQKSIAIMQGCQYETGDNANTNANVYISSGLDLYPGYWLKL